MIEFKGYPRGKTGAARFADAAASLARRLAEQAAQTRSDPRPAAAEPVSDPDWLHYVPAGARDIVRSSLPAGLLEFLAQPGVPLKPAGSAEAALPARGQFLTKAFENQAGRRPYRLYIPSGYRGQPVPLIVMLHGCTQSPDDFAAGTAMNGAAEAQTCLVAYPGQTTDAHAQRCWKWFNADDQKRDRGEPSLIAGITRQVMADYAVDPQRVYVAGLSAGGAAAAIMGETYPDLYGAIGVHSGLPCGAAQDVPSALAVMKRGGANPLTAQPGAAQRRIVPAIVFHGDRDATVNAQNGADIVARSTRGAGLDTQVHSGQAPGGHRFTRTIYCNRAGHSVIEQWLIHNAGHAWSGGSTTGSYTDPRGPDATREMLRFFQEHPHPTPGLE